MTLFDDDGEAPPPPWTSDQVPEREVERATRPIIEGEPRPTWTLEEVREYLGARRHDSVVCPACDQHVKVYRRSISSTSARALIALYRAAGTDYAHLPTVLNRKQADEAKLVHWGLLEQQPGERDDGSTRTGWWRVTEKGVDFIYRRIKVEKHVLLYAARCLGLDDTDGYIDIVDALGKKFRYDELMAGDG